VRAAASAVAAIARSHEVVVTHGNGPQVGYLAMRDAGATGAETLDLLSAESEGLIGYLIERELASIFPFSDVATLLTQVEVDADDPAFQTPTKPIGPRVAAAEAEDLGRRMGWRFAESNGGFRRVVPSPEPLRIRELRTIQLCVDAGVLVVCAGGGGIPIVSFPEGFRGVEAVIDKDRTAALLASELHADVLLLLTDVPAVYEDWPEPRTRALRTISVASLARLELDAGSMGPKVEAAGRFAAAGGDARIGSLDEAREVLAGRAGTRVRAGDVATDYWAPSPPRTDAETGG
jgi:carbamate kinase